MTSGYARYLAAKTTVDDRALNRHVLAEAGLTVIWRQECSSSHHAMATALLRCYRADSPQIVGQIGPQATAELITAHQLWSDWLGSGRVRKFALVAEKQ